MWDFISLSVGFRLITYYIEYNDLINFQEELNYSGIISNYFDIVRHCFKNISYYLEILSHCFDIVSQHFEMYVI